MVNLYVYETTNYIYHPQGVTSFTDKTLLEKPCAGCLVFKMVFCLL